MNGRFDQDIEAHFDPGAEVARGGFGAIRIGHERATGAKVAIKTLQPVSADESGIDRFRLEAALLGRIRNRHVVRSLADGRLRSGELCLVLEWIEGVDLSRARKTESFTLRDTLEIARQAARGLAALHVEGVVHRDVKPANFMFRRGTDDLTVTLIDLGIARDLGGDGLTRVGERIGTPAYMSPEQIRGDASISFASDIFSLGVMLWELIAGKRLFQSRSMEEVFARILLQVPADVRAHVPGVPEEVSVLVRGALEKRVDLRPRDATAFAEQIARVLGAGLADGAFTREALARTERPPPPDLEDERANAPTRRSVTDRLDRFVTILFATSETAGQAAALFGDVAAVLAAHGATVLRTPGTQTLGTFGLEQTRGDEARRAALAALAIQRTFPAVGVVITTGRTNVGASGIGEELIERASRLEAAARSIARPAICLDVSTARLLEASFSVVREQDVWLLGEAPRRALDVNATLLGRATRTVGRDRELADIDAAFARARDGRRGGGIVLQADAGEASRA
ncbi:MAG: serine/threonine-protein kinase [Deltaproteobacteria bacterium]